MRMDELQKALVKTGDMESKMASIMRENETLKNEGKSVMSINDKRV
jgi:hypothetical protein